MRDIESIYMAAKKAATAQASKVTAAAYDTLPPYRAPAEFTTWNGDKFEGGFGITQLQIKDYWTLRARSEQLFNDNLYAFGLIKRLVTNEINTGLTPEAIPEEEVLGRAEGDLNDWTETVESRWHIWAQSPLVCDYKKADTFGILQYKARMEALISGDVLFVMRVDPRTGAPSVQLVGGHNVRSPIESYSKVRKGHEVKHGVEIDPAGRQVAYWVKQNDGNIKRMPAFGEKSGRRIAWMVYGTDKRIDDVRGTPLLGLVLQSLKDVDRYRDSALRKAVVNSLVAMFIKKTADKMGTLPLTGAAVRKGAVEVEDPDGSVREFNIQKHLPGIAMEELQTGEEPVLLGGQGTDTNFGTFEASIIQAVAWANELPPEILTLAFSNNFSASQAAINEFKIYLNKVWATWGASACTPVYKEWLVSEVLQRKIAAPGMLDAWRDPAQYDVYGAWSLVEWYGSIKPSTDMLKQAKGSKMLVENGWSTNAREARVTTGTKFRRNVKRLKRENEQLAEALKPMAEAMAEISAAGASPEALDDLVYAVRDQIENE